LKVSTATLDDREHGLSEEALVQADVLTWWGHMAHEEVKDEVVERVYRRVLKGMGLIVLHSGHFSKIFRKLMGTSCNLKWREAGEKERLWVVSPDHPIAAGLGEFIEIEHEEMYGEFFDIPAPDTLVFASWFKGGEVFRSGCCYQRGQGRIFYFRPGHETYPTYYNPQVMQAFYNAVLWAAPKGGPEVSYGHRPQSLEPLG
jgi:trehalose utilization protein